MTYSYYDKYLTELVFYQFYQYPCLSHVHMESIALNQKINGNKYTYAYNVLT